MECQMVGLPPSGEDCGLLPSQSDGFRQYIVGIRLLLHSDEDFVVVVVVLAMS